MKKIKQIFYGLAWLWLPLLASELAGAILEIIF